MIAGLAMALVFSAQPLIAKAQESANRGEIAESAMVQAINREERNDPPPQLVSAAASAQPRPRNPYRLGRRRRPD
jgi:hypothetical protein